MISEGVSFGVADGVGGWVDSGVDPALFSQALMYHAHRYSRNAWAGEPEIDPTMDYEEREQIEGWEMTPYECLDLAYGGVLREKYVLAGMSMTFFFCMIMEAFLDWSRISLFPFQPESPCRLVYVMLLTFWISSGSSTACIISLNASSGVLRSAKYVAHLFP